MNLLDLLAPSDPLQSLPRGHVIIHEGAPGHLMYVVAEGHVEILMREQLVDIIGPGGFFGEMSLIDDNPRVANAIARTDCKLAIVDREKFREWSRKSPDFALEVMKTLASRLRREMRMNAPP